MYVETGTWRHEKMDWRLTIDGQTSVSADSQQVCRLANAHQIISDRESHGAVRYGPRPGRTATDSAAVRCLPGVARLASQVGVVQSRRWSRCLATDSRPFARRCGVGRHTQNATIWSPCGLGGWVMSFSAQLWLRQRRKVRGGELSLPSEGRPAIY